jgi:hypothetical protein
MQVERKGKCLLTMLTMAFSYTEIHEIYYCVEFTAFMALSMKSTVFWGEASCIPKQFYWRFEGAFCFWILLLSYWPPLKSREYGRKDPSRWPRDILYPQKLTLTSPTSDGRSVGIVRLRTQDTEFFLLSYFLGLVFNSEHGDRLSPKRRYIYFILHGLISHKTVLLKYTLYDYHYNYYLFVR